MLLYINKFLNVKLINSLKFLKIFKKNRNFKLNTLRIH